MAAVAGNAMLYTWLGVLPSLSLYLYLSGSQWWNFPGGNAVEQQAPVPFADLTGPCRSDIEDRTTVTITSNPLALTGQTSREGGSFVGTNDCGLLAPSMFLGRRGFQDRLIADPPGGAAVVGTCFSPQFKARGQRVLRGGKRRPGTLVPMRPLAMLV